MLVANDPCVVRWFLIVVSNSPQINYLMVKKPKPVGIVNVFHTLFSDESMYSYNYSGICNHGTGRKAMQNYTIFVDCMLG